MGSPYFDVIEPQGADSPVVVEIPHASTAIPPFWLAQMVAPARAVAFDADLYVDELFGKVVNSGATLLIARVSRYVIDLNRDPSAALVDAPSRAIHPPKHGLVWSRTSGDAAIYERPVDKAEVQHRLDTIHRPYHETLRALLVAKQRRHGFAVLLAAHSMPSPATGRGVSVADVVPGTRNKTSAGPLFVRAIEDHARSAGFSLCHDHPYAGGYTTQYYGRPTENVHALQIEMARRLYLDENTLARKQPDFEHTAAWCEALAARLGSIGRNA